LTDLLKAATGERSLFGKIGAWRLAVSQAADAASTPAQYINSKNSAEQALIGANTSIVVDSDINVRGITRPSSTAFQLTPGKTYYLHAHARFHTFSDPTGGELTVRWVDDANQNIPNALVAPDAVASLHVPATNTDNESGDPVVDVIYTVPDSVLQSQVKLRCTAGTGTATLPANGVSVSIKEIK
jgi:hypothetical protein